MAAVPYVLPSVTDLIILAVALIMIWVIASIPAYIAGKVVTGGRATFGEAMSATLGGVIVFIIVLVGVSFFLGTLIGSSAMIWAIILAFIAFLAVYRAAFHTSWLGALAITIVAVVVALVLDYLIGLVFGISFTSVLPHMVRV